jgi:hypothetical protein
MPAKDVYHDTVKNALIIDVTHIASKFHRFHRWLFTFYTEGVETNPNGVIRE